MRSESCLRKVWWVAGIALLMLFSACAPRAAAGNGGDTPDLLSSCDWDQTLESLPLVPIPGYEIGQPLTISLAVRNLKFDQKLIEVPAGIRLTIVFTNDDDVPHNFALYRNSKAEDALFISDMVEARSTASFNFITPDSPSLLFFRSDSALEMSGTLRILG